MRNQRASDGSDAILRNPLRSLVAAVLGIWLFAGTAPLRGVPDAAARSLPEPIIHPHSTEICLNSRLSYHGAWSGSATDQMLADVLSATAQAPVTGLSRTIYLATHEAVYIYTPEEHDLVVHKTGDWRSDATAAFEVGVAADNMVDAGAAMDLSQLESVALWTGTANQLASCPRASATTYANSHWDPADPVDIVISFGLRSVAGFTSTLVAISSDGSLPNPHADGSVFMDTAIADLAFGPTFSPEDLSLEEISQLLWASYGCSNHTASGKAGLVCPSAVANYYLTRRIYAVGGQGVHRYHVRRPPGTDGATRDHRIELVTPGDPRQTLRAAVPGLPDAPRYLLICVGATGAWPELEVGFAAMGAVLEASTMGLQGYVNTGLTAPEQAAIRQATGIPSADMPIAIVSLGRPLPGMDVGAVDRAGHLPSLTLENSVSAGAGVVANYRLPADAAVDMTVYDCTGHTVRRLIDEKQAGGSHTLVWDCRDDQGHPVLSGVYFCRLRADHQTAGARIVVVR